ncbi:MAG: Cys-tRNA(Pro) deacylase [Planctomycetia bacterium]|nr:Cys-tRNA(Pro) deacylase [Planctomycetia bacterium]
MTPAIKLLEQAGVPFQVLTYEHDDACMEYGLEAAGKLQVDPASMFKTLVVKSDTGTLAIALLSVQDKVDLKKLAHAFGTRKADLADSTLAEKTTGYVIGGISPLGGRKKLMTFIDEAVILVETIYVSAGKRGMQLKLAADDLIRLTAASVVPLAVVSQG